MGSGLDDIAGAARIGEGRTAGALAPVEEEAPTAVEAYRNSRTS